MDKGIDVRYLDSESSGVGRWPYMQAYGAAIALLATGALSLYLQLVSRQLDSVG